MEAALPSTGAVFVDTLSSPCVRFAGQLAADDFREARELLRHELKQIIERDDAEETSVFRDNRKTTHALRAHELQGLERVFVGTRGNELSGLDAADRDGICVEASRGDLQHDVAVGDDTDRNPQTTVHLVYDHHAADMLWRMIFAAAATVISLVPTTTSRMHNSPIVVMSLS